MSEAEHSREDELEIIIIGLQGKIEKLEKEKQDLIKDLRELISEWVNVDPNDIDTLIKKWEDAIEPK